MDLKLFWKILHHNDWIQNNFVKDPLNIKWNDLSNSCYDILSGLCITLFKDTNWRVVLILWNIKNNFYSVQKPLDLGK